MPTATSAALLASITFSQNGSSFAKLYPAAPADRLTISSTLSGFVIDTSGPGPILIGQPGSTASYLMNSNGPIEFPAICALYLDPATRQQLRIAEMEMLTHSLSDAILRAIFKQDPTPGYNAGIARTTCQSSCPLAAICCGRKIVAVSPLWAISRRDFNLGAVIEHASEAIALLAERKDQQLTVQLPEGGCQVNADATRIEQVILNLLANAVKYTPPSGHISLKVSNGEAETVVSVADNGPGVPEEDRECIFERFYRSKQDAANSASGTGLGLPIARMLVELHGGRLWLEDALGGGSIFRFGIHTGVES